MKPLPFTWPWWIAFYGVFAWAFMPEFRIVSNARKATRGQRSRHDRGSLQVIMMGQWIAYVAAFSLAGSRVWQFPGAWQVPAFALGLAMTIAGSLLRRHCFRMLGASFTGEVRADAAQRVVTSGAYRWLRHPSYTAGIMMNTGLGIALGSWASALVMLVVSFAGYVYRMSVEERALASEIGEPYRQFMRTRKRVIPFVY